MAALGVALLEAEELDFLGDEVEDVDHSGGEVVVKFEMGLLGGAKLHRGLS